MSEVPQPVHPAFVTTLSEVPGYPTVRALGVVAGIGTGSGNSARSKGISAYVEALDGMRTDAAANFGANAIVGLTVSNFGSSIGGAFGDAVGITLLGTAVVIGTAETT